MPRLVRIETDDVKMTEGDNDSDEAKLDLPFYRRIGLTLLVGLAGAVAALILFALLAGWVLEGETKHFDDEVLATIHQYASPGLTSLMRLLTTLGSTFFLVLLGVFLFSLGIRRKRAVVLFAITMAGAALLIWVLKLGFHRARPMPFFEIPAPRSYSFPSGHALAAFCFYGGLATIMADRIRSSKGRLIIWTLAVLFIALIGFSRVYLGVHYPSDVIAGYAAGFVWVMTLASVDRLVLRRLRKGSSKGIRKGERVR
jgi:membrane-associated phospholipid phosphatase